jgi:hypothetical protein
MVDLSILADDYLLATDKKNDEIYFSVLAKRNNPKFIERTGGNIPPINEMFLVQRDEIKAEINRRNLKVTNGN